MSKRRGIPWTQLAVMLALACLIGRNAAAEQTEALPASDPKQVVLYVGQSRLLPVFDLKRVAVGNPEVADVRVVSDRELMVLGKRAGMTNLILWEGNVRTTHTVVVSPLPDESQIVILPLKNVWLKKYDLKVGEDISWTFEPDTKKVEELSNALKMILPADRFSVNTEMNSLTIQGSASEIAAVESLLKKWDTKKPQVVIETSVVQVSESALKELGIASLLQSKNVQFFKGAESGEGALTTSSVGGFKIEPPEGIEGTMKLTPLGDLSEAYISKIRALQETGKARVLANPRIMSVVQEKDAAIFLGDQVPVKSVTATATGVVEEVKFVPIGILLDILPKMVHEDGSITIVVVTDVRTITGQVEGNPVFSSNQVVNEVRVRSGEAIVIGGLLREKEVENIAKVPLLSELPILGNLFRNVSKSKEKTELVAIITPTIVSDKGETIPPEAEPSED